MICLVGREEKKHEFNLILHVNNIKCVRTWEVYLTWYEKKDKERVLLC